MRVGICALALATPDGLGGLVHYPERFVIVSPHCYRKDLTVIPKSLSTNGKHIDA